MHRRGRAIAKRGRHHNQLWRGVLVAKSKIVHQSTSSRSRRTPKESANEVVEAFSEDLGFCWSFENKASHEAQREKSRRPEARLKRKAKQQPLTSSFFQTRINRKHKRQPPGLVPVFREQRTAERCGMVKIIRNVGGVPGLDLASDAFSEDIKRQLFSSRVLFANAPEEASRCTERHVHATGPHHWDASVWCVSNLLGDLFPDKHVPPDYCLALNYPPGAGFNFHCDSCFRWGECVWGVSLGQEAILSFLNCGGKHTECVKDERLNLEVKETDSGKIQVNLQLPRRSIYVMHGPARLAWKHGILKQTKNRLKQLPKPPFWNPWNLRRSLTFRTTKAYSDAYLQLLLEQSPNDAQLQARWKAQKKMKPQGDYGEGVASKQDLELLRSDGRRALQKILTSPLRDARFGIPSTTIGGSAAGAGNDLPGMTSTGGHRLGGGCASVSEEEQLQAAIRASLAEQHGTSSSNAKKRKPSAALSTANKRSNKRTTKEDLLDVVLPRKKASKTQPESAGRLKGSASDGSATNPISIDDESDDEDDVETEQDHAVKRETPEKEDEGEDSERQRIRMARIRHFEEHY